MNGAAKQIGVVLVADVEELDAMGPWEVLSYWTCSHPRTATRSPVCPAPAASCGARRASSCRRTNSFADAPGVDVLVHPGGNGTRPQLHDDNHLDWVRRQSESSSLMTSVCTGSLVCAAAGPLTNRPATTHWASLDLLAELDPTIDVRRDARFVDDGDVVTSAGVSAGIDMALHLVARLAGTERAREVRRAIQVHVAARP